MILTKTLGFCVEALGPEAFLEFVPIVVGVKRGGEAKDPATRLPTDTHYYLLQVMNDHVRHTQSHLRFFFEQCSWTRSLI